MSYLRQGKTTCGRFAKMPNEKDDSQVYEDDSLPLQDQIDNLRAKISLKEKYNKALMEEVLETNQGAAMMLADLNRQNKTLREDLVYEKEAEKYAVKKALRSYRLFQLAVSEKSAEGVINWLDDKIFDASKTLNLGMFLLRKMQDKLAEAEANVRYLERCPIPGSEEWEKKEEEARIALYVAIENGKCNRDAATMLYKKYKEVLYFLRAERGKWPHIMGTLEKTLASLKTELSSLETMLEDAIRFREEAEEKLKVTEEEASANRKQRRMQMSKMKKAVEKALQANTAKYATNPNAGGDNKSVVPAESTQSMIVENSSGLAKGYSDIKRKQILAQDYETRANRLVSVMSVKDLRFCPGRLLTVRKVGDMLKQELAMKQNVRELLLKHKYRMELILQYFRYTGSQNQEDFQKEIEDREKMLTEADHQLMLKGKETTDTGDILTTLRLGLIGVDELFNQGKKKPPHAHAEKSQEMTVLMKKLAEKVKGLVNDVEALQKEFPASSKAQRSYLPYIKFNIPTRYIRVGATEEMEADDDSDNEPGEDVSSRVPTREELKAKSERIRSQAMLRKGIR